MNHATTGCLIPFTLEDGLLTTMATAFASRQTTFTVYKAKVVPLPQKDQDMAIKLK